MCARAQVSKKLQAGRKRCSSVGWTQQAEIDLLCEFWSRLANGKPAYRFPFNGFNARAVNDKLVHMELLLDDPRLFRMPCSTPEHQQSIIISDCRLLANSEGKVTLGKGMEGAEGVMWERGNGALQQCPNDPMPQCPNSAIAAVHVQSRPHTCPWPTPVLSLTRSADVASTPAPSSPEKQSPPTRQQACVTPCPR